MIDEILSTISGGQARIALRQEGRLVGLIIAGPGAPDTVGTIALGRVKAVLPGLEAAFVDIGAERAGFLSLIPPRGENDGGENEPGGLAPVREGDEVLVQVTKGAQAGKGAGLTRNVALAGRTLVLTPFQSRIAISRRIIEPDQRAALERVMAE
ncbi:MAG: hypothetical protein O7F75_12400, partial [Alphaproteobacteria bacterium]|nr:hypothetical protein [Alphaproteobacteria bacterium]